MIDTYEYGYPEYQRISIITEAKKASTETYYEEYEGKYRNLPVIELRIEAPVYRMENIRTKNLQKEWLAQNTDLPKDILTSDPTSIAAQEIQHRILYSLANKENLLTEFSDGKTFQTTPIICSDNGIVVNGNRRLCAWRTLYYSDKEKFKHFQTIRVAVLPDHDPKAMYDLEVALQIKPDMKAEYEWHAIAADCKEKMEQGIAIGDIANKIKKSPEDVNTCIRCYDYAAEYLEGIGRANEWSLVDKQEYALRRIVNSVKNLEAAGDKELFKAISNSMLQVPASGDRLYDQIPKVSKNLDSIANKLKDILDIEDTPTDDDLDFLGGNDVDAESTQNALIAAGIRAAENPGLVVEAVKTVLETREELEKEKKKKSFVLDQVVKAATALNNAVSNLNDSMSKDGIDKQLANIDATCTILKDWIK